MHSSFCSHSTHRSQRLNSALCHRTRKLIIVKAAVSRRISTPGMGEQKVSFTNPNTHHKLVGILNDAKTPNVVILCHGYSGSKEGFVYPQLAKALALKNLGSLRFDFSGNGESEGAFEFGNYYQEVSDLRAAVEYVRNGLGKKVAAIVGHSKGGNVVLLYAAQHDDVPLVVNVAGRFHMKEGIKERFGEETLARVDKLGQVQMTARTDAGQTIQWLLTKQSLEERCELDMAAVCRRIALSEVLTVHGTQDTTIPPPDAEQFSKHIRQHVLYWVEGADHCFRTPAHADQLVRKVVEYIVQMS